MLRNAQAVFGLDHFMGVSDPFAGHGIEQVEGEWRQLIEKLLSDDDAVLELQVFFKPWDKSWVPSVDEARKTLALASATGHTSNYLE